MSYSELPILKHQDGFFFTLSLRAIDLLANNRLLYVELSTIFYEGVSVV
jgi:hypothetical protein